MSALTFKQKIAIININPYVSPPQEILLALFHQAKKTTSPIPIKGKINGAKFQKSLVKYQGVWRLYINEVIAKAAGIKWTKSISEIVDRVISIEMEFDPHPPTYPMDPFLQKALSQNSIALKNWETLPASRQKEILRYLSRLKSTEAHTRNLENILSVLTGKEIRFMARSWKDGK